MASTLPKDCRCVISMGIIHLYEPLTKSVVYLIIPYGQDSELLLHQKVGTVVVTDCSRVSVPLSHRQ